MNMKKEVVARTIEEVTILVKEKGIGMFPHVTNVVNKDTRWYNVLRIKVMGKGTKQGKM